MTTEPPGTTYCIYQLTADAALACYCKLGLHMHCAHYCCVYNVLFLIVLLLVNKVKESEWIVIAMD